MNITLLKYLIIQLSAFKNVSAYNPRTIDTQLVNVNKYGQVSFQQCGHQNTKFTKCIFFLNQH